MGKLNLEPHIHQPDEIYAALSRLHAGRPAEESALLNARLIMLLINQIGDEQVVLDAIEQAAARPQRFENL